MTGGGRGLTGSGAGPHGYLLAAGQQGKKETLHASQIGNTQPRHRPNKP